MALPLVRVALAAGLCSVAFAFPRPVAAQNVAREDIQVQATGPGRLLIPPGRPPVVLAIGVPANLPDQLAARGIAVQADALARPTFADPHALELVANMITTLRNDPRFRTVSVVVGGESVRLAAAAVRVARADALVSDGAFEEPVSVPVRNVTLSAASAAGEIAAFLDDVPPLGLRGGRNRERSTSPRMSPRMTTVSTLPGTEARVGIEYGQPGKRGRQIWGGLVRWDRVWMPGADEATTFTTDATLTIGGSLVVEPGDYTFYALPRADGFTLIVSRETGQFHTVYNEGEDLGRVEMAMREREDLTERMTFLIEPDGASGGDIILRWDDREYAVAFTRASVIPGRQGARE